MSDTNRESTAKAGLHSDVSRPDKSRQWLAMLALLLAMAAATMAWLAWQAESDEWASADSLSQHGERLDRMAESLADVERRLDQVGDDISSIGSETEQLGQGLERLPNRIEALDDRLATLETRVEEGIESRQVEAGEQRQVDREVERRLRLIEAASLARLGQDRAELAGDWAGARSAYQRASEHLRRVDDARLNRARTLLARELEALQRVDEPDWQSWSGRLAHLASASSEWPSRGRSPDDSAAATAADSESQESGWLARAGQSFGALVRIQPRTEAEITPEQVDSAREMLAMRLTAAELALARRDLAELAHHAAQARTLIQRWFEIEDPSVARALEDLETLRELDWPAMPSLGDGLAEINRQLESS